MAVLHGLAPVEPRNARVLILGSMPGAASLQAQQYYAHPQNLFWPFMEELLAIPRVLPYEQRARALAQRHVALWDVIASCRRPGSLDSSIREARANDFRAFLQRQRGLRAVGLNGRAAQAMFLKHVAPMLGTALDAVDLVMLPSSSPANASIRRADKLKAWARIGEYLHP